MLEADFQRLPEGRPKKIAIGEIFLEGEKIIEQKTTKHKGDLITYYIIIKLYNNKRYEYVPYYEKLE